jgi:hypothetical protein
MDARKNDLELRIDLSKHRFNKGENIEVEANLKNMTSEDIVVRKMDAMLVFGDDFANLNGIELLIISSTTGLTLKRGGLLYSSLDEGIPPPKAFSVIPSNGISSTTFALSDIFGSIPVDDYSIQMVYTNYDFGAAGQTESETYFIDYNAWIGTISSNTEFFQVVP